MPALPTKNHDARKCPVGSKLSCCILYVKSNNIFNLVIAYFDLV